MDDFLGDARKKSVSDGIRQRNKKKKLLRESARREVHSISQNITSTTPNERGVSWKF
uniref:Uncharacterized protein n=1 Tax=Rhizophagus irregularis (strain DAOM 181602 / DAOM 197198 / MUCL 43194) TaxID=747089 RepID=U9SJJ7_RHIID